MLSNLRKFRISVIIPCHNAEPWIAAALRSVAEQTVPADEIIVIDDNSTDNSIQQVEQSGVPVNLLRVKVHNAAAARNAGLEIATGDWIALLDADDIWYPQHLERAITLLHDTNDVAFMSNHDWIGLDGALIEMPEEFRCKLSSPAKQLTVEHFFNIANQGFHFGHSTVLYRRERVLEVGKFDISQKRRHDVDLWLRVIAGHHWTYDTVKSAGYREETPGSISKNHLECDYYYLRALTKNLVQTDCPPARHYLARQARRAMGIAFVDGPPEHYIRIRQTAWPYLSKSLKLFYRCGNLCAPLLRRMMRLRRKLTKHQAAPKSNSA